MPVQPLRIRKLADQSVPREARYNPRTGQKYLIDPATGEASPRPLLGIKFEGKPPKKTCVSQNFVRKGKKEGWIEVEGQRIVQRSSGPPEEPVSPENPPHTFIQADAIVFDTVDGPVRYKVTRNPDKWPKKKEKSELLEDHGFGGEVHWTYELSLES